MEEKILNEEKLQRFERLLERLERISEVEPPRHPHHKPPHPPAPHHLEKRDLKINFHEDESLLLNIFGDEDTTKAVIDIMTKSPAEIQIILKVVIDLHNQINKTNEE